LNRIGATSTPESGRLFAVSRRSPFQNFTKVHLGAIWGVELAIWIALGLYTV